ncbi:MAG: class I SAM-dependent methyltransferase [Candidatus Paceibacterota bacterium]
MNVPNNFGKLSKAYVKGRRGYPKELFDYLHSFTKIKKPLTLDIGCGTGISTRELKKHGFQTSGADKDKAMIETAKTSSKGITYIAAPANELPFPSEYFDLVTAFTSFHWFEDKKSIEEIKRVLKPGGIFFAALKQTRQSMNRDDFYENYKSILRKYAGKYFNSARNYEPRDSLTKYRFKKIKENTFYLDEKYSIKEALVLIQSLSFWHMVPKPKRPNMLKELYDLYKRYSTGGKLTIHREVITTLGIKTK